MELSDLTTTISKQSEGRRNELLQQLSDTKSDSSKGANDVHSNDDKVCFQVRSCLFDSVFQFFIRTAVTESLKCNGTRYQQCFKALILKRISNSMRRVVPSEHFVVLVPVE